MSDSAREALLADLNEAQRRAVTHIDGPLLVLAGPGSGKTRVITRRAAYLVHSGIAARSILAITFTNKATDEMKRRIEALGVARGMWVYTFHALGVRLLREFGPLANVQPGFTIFDDDDQRRLLREALAAEQVSETFLRPEMVQHAISTAKNKLLTPEQFAACAGDFHERTIARVYAAYQRMLERQNAVDFDDLLMRVAIVLRDHPEIAERLNIRFRYVLIDEYQDTNHAQYLIARYLSQYHRNLCVTGDPDQSIYAWRGADISNILEFERDYEDAVVVRLEQNYRSTGAILRAADRLVACNRRRKAKKLWTENAEGEPVRLWEFSEGGDEAEHIARTIRALVDDQGREYGDIAIAYRVNALSRGLEEALRNHGIPYRVARGLEFYNRREIRDTLAYLRVLVNPADELSLLRIINVPARGIGRTTIDRLRDAAAEAGRPLIDVLRGAAQIPALKTAARKIEGFVRLLEGLAPLFAGPVSVAVSEVLKRSGLEAALRAEDAAEGEDRLANVQELVTAAVAYEQQTDEPSLAEFVNRIALTSDQDAIDERRSAVLLLTLHAAKGLEFPVVFIVGLEQGLLPHERALRGDGDVEEERRLCFVGLTRARELLVLSRARQRVIRGVLMPRAASMFVHEVGDETVVQERFLRDSWGRMEHEGGPRFVPLEHEDAPPEGARARRRFANAEPDEPAAQDEPRRGRGLRAASEDFAFGANRPARGKTPLAAKPAAPAPEPVGLYAGWKAGTLVEHDSYGVGQVLWVRANPGQTRAAILFAGYGEKTLILERAPVRLLTRRRR
jgi:DNA helicase-2/ATP-dependent DNA helicase PcrA